MSNLMIFAIKDNLKYDQSVLLSKKIISYCLNKNLGAIFNFLGYCDELIDQLGATMYFSISDDFIQLNSEYLSTSNINHIKQDSGKQKFIDKFSFLNEICDILCNFGLTKICVLISPDGGVHSIDDLKAVDKNTELLTDVLYQGILESHDKYAYDFPNMIINISQ